MYCTHVEENRDGDSMKDLVCCCKTDNCFPPLPKKLMKMIKHHQPSYNNVKIP